MDVDGSARSAPFTDQTVAPDLAAQVVAQAQEAHGGSGAERTR